MEIELSVSVESWKDCFGLSLKGKAKERQSLGEVQSYSLEYRSQTWTDPPVWWPSDAFNLLEAREPEAAFGSCGIMWALPDTAEWGLFFDLTNNIFKYFPLSFKTLLLPPVCTNVYLYKHGFENKTLIRVYEYIRNKGTSALTVSSPSRCAPA